MPSLTVRALAELMDLPAYEQLRILTEQKYPRQGPAQFKAPFYAPALRVIRLFYRNNNNPSIVTAGNQMIDQTVRLSSKKTHNIRVVDTFFSSAQAARRFSILTNTRYVASIGSVDVRLHFDLIAREGADTRYILYNFRTVPISQDGARVAIEVAGMVLQQLGHPVPMNSIEYIDLSNGAVFSTDRIRKRTATRVMNNANLINTLWQSI